VITFGGVPHVDVHPDLVDEVAADGELAEPTDGGVERVHALVGGGGHRGVDPALPVLVQPRGDLCSWARGRLLGNRPARARGGGAERGNF
jgi:hypothetical protein